MKKVLAAVTLLSLACPSVLPAQQDGNGLEVRPDPQNVVASVLLGEWQLDEALNRRLGRRGGVARLEFREDAAVLQRIPAAIAGKLKERRIFLAGVMAKGDAEHVYLLMEHSGNTAVVWFRPRGGDPCGDAESWIVSAARAEARQADLLFVGGDSNNQSFAAYTRATGVVGKLTPAAALTDMIRLLEAGKAEEFVDTYVAPTDLAKMIEAGRTREQLVARFARRQVEVLIDRMKAAVKQPPTFDASGDVASFAIEGRPDAMKLQRIDGRWYVRER